MLNKCLLLDQDLRHRDRLRSFCQSLGFEVCTADSVQDTRSLLDQGTIDIAFIDLDAIDGECLEILGDARLRRAEIVMMGSHDEISRADESMRAGASYYFCKPFDPEYLRQLLQDIAAEKSHELYVDDDSADMPGALDQFGFMRGSSPKMRGLYRILRKVAVTEATLLIVGESGTGKELLAQTVHELSPRSNGPFIAFNCASIAENLVESEMFGHERGSFSGASKRHRGFFERASGGTLLLDEITEMNQELQSRLLRVLEENRLRRVGSETDLPVDVRIISATNRDPRQAVDDGLLREDLYYRLAQFPLHLPPLRDRGGDVTGLAQFFLNELNNRHGSAIEFTVDALDAINAYPWPGNVRQLRHAVERAYIVSEALIEADSLFGDDTSIESPAVSEGVVPVEFGSTLAEAERKIILATLERHDGDKKRTASELGISLKTLYNRINEYQRDSGQRTPV